MRLRVTLRVRLFVERLADERVLASVLHVPPSGDGALLALLDEAPAKGERAPRGLEAVERPLPSPRMAALAETLEDAKRALAARIAAQAGDLDPAEVARRFRLLPEETLLGAEARLLPIDAEGKELPAVRLPFSLVLSRMPRPPHRVTVPKLGLCLAVDDPEGAPAAAEAEVAALLRRAPALRRLERVADLFPAAEERLETLEVEAEVQTPLDVLEARRASVETAGARRAKEEREELLSVAADLCALSREGKLAPAHEHEDAVREVLAFLRGAEERALALVGPSGAGKTAALEEAVRRQVAEADAARGAPPPVPVYRTSGARLIAGMCAFGAWQERCRAVVAAVGRERGVLALGDPHELLDEGTSTMSSTTIAQFLKRPIEDGKLRALAECTDEAWEALERRDRSFAALFRVVRVREPERPRLIAVLGRVAADLRAEGRCTFREDALAACADLFARFAPYEAFPGKAVRFLRREARARPADPAHAIGRAEMVRAFARASALPEELLADDVPLDPEDVRRRLRAHVVGQEPAVAHLAALLARVKAGVADPRRPLGSFLFLGPTGVGKTETAKALAALVFGSEERLARIDMSEYQDGRAAARLLGGARGEGDGALVRRVRAEPFTVLLLDEVEKADPGVFDLLLQVLGEARLTDAKGRTTDFRSAIVVLTSNLGAEAPEGALGFAGPASDDAAAAAAAERFRRAAEGFFRPELIARLDAVIPFRPLPREAIRAIAAREVERALSREGLERRGVAASADPAVLERALEEGFHPRYGARPLKRAVERLVAVPLAECLSSRWPPPRRVRVAFSEDGLPEARVLEGAAPEGGPLLSLGGAAGTDLSEEHARLRAEELMRRISGARRAAQALARDDALLDARDERETLAAERRRQSRHGRRRTPSPVSVPGFDASADGARLRRVAAAIDAAEAARKAAEELEELAAIAFVEGDAAALAALAPDLGRVEARLAEAAFDVRALRFRPGDAALLLLAPSGRGASLVPELFELYAAHAAVRGLHVHAHAEARAERRPKEAVQWTPADEHRPFGPGVGWVAAGAAAPLPGEGGALALLVTGANAVPRFTAEAGRHRLIPPKAGDPERMALVRVRSLKGPGLGLALAGFRTLRNLHDKGAPGVPAALPEVVRVYDERATPCAVKEARLGLTLPERRLPHLAGAGLDRIAREFLASRAGALAADELNDDAAGGGGS